MPAYYRSSLANFIGDDASAIVGTLTSKHGKDGFYSMILNVAKSWNDEIAILKEASRILITTHSDATNWSLLLEYPIPRRQRRIDAIILTRSLVIVLEFKIGANTFESAAKQQVEDYCLDLRDFHSDSRELQIVPLLVASKSQELIIPAEVAKEQVTEPHCCGKDTLAKLLMSIVKHYERDGVSISADDWDRGLFSPTPTIVEAAQMLYHVHNVSEITRSGAGESDLQTTSDKVVSIIDKAKTDNAKVVCFVTGVPGSGKTLIGLNLVHHPKLMSHDQGIATFMSGNIPLINVLREALARNISELRNVPIGGTRHDMNHTIQNIHDFARKMFGDDQKRPPKDKVIIYDEAQRAWNAEKNESKYHIPYSEPEMILDVMNRHSGWCVLVCLVGSGQEIHNGEAGLTEWARALSTRPEWSVHVPSELQMDFGGPGRQHPEQHLHLSTSQRSFKAQSLATWIDCVLQDKPDNARDIASDMHDYPILLTRSLESSRSWLKQTTKGFRRCGLIASSGARRLRAYGLDVTTDVDEELWFLNPRDDVRSSYSLEVPATEFAVQGLELDFAGLCWGADFRRENNSWDYFSFAGTEWNHVGLDKDDRRRFITNKYRVLLSRAREGLIIWVPNGNQDDRTNYKALFSETAEYLLRCGALPHP